MAVKGTTDTVPLNEKRAHLVVLRQDSGGSLMKTCRGIIASDWANEKKTTAGCKSYETYCLGKVIRISITLPTTVAKYVLETWEDLKRLQEEFKTATFETAIATFFTITAVDRLDIAICLDTIRSVAKQNMIPFMKRISTTATNEETFALELTDELKSSDRTATVAKRTRANNDSESDVDYMQRIHRWGDRETERGTN